MSITTKAAHTPGPWTVSKSHRYVRYHHGESFDYNICDCDMGCPPDEIKANARLIAAAPRMLEALESLVGEIRGTFNKWRLEQFAEAAEAAIQKAKGTHES